MPLPSLLWSQLLAVFYCQWLLLWTSLLEARLGAVVVSGLTPLLSCRRPHLLVAPREALPGDRMSSPLGSAAPPSHWDLDLQWKIRNELAPGWLGCHRRRLPLRTGAAKAPLALWTGEVSPLTPLHRRRRPPLVKTAVLDSLWSHLHHRHPRGWKLVSGLLLGDRLWLRLAYLDCMALPPPGSAAPPAHWCLL